MRTRGSSALSALGAPGIMWIVAGLAFAAPSLALAERAVPAASARIVDEAEVFTPEERGRVDAGLAKFEQSVGPQILVLTVKSLEGDTIEGYAIRVAEKWKAGNAKKNDGLIVVLATEDHRVRIEVGQGLEGTLPDVLAGRIVRESMVPYFRADRYRDGLVSGLRAIATQLGGSLDGIAPPEAPPRRVGRDSGQGTPLLMYIFLGFLLIFVLLPRIFGRSRPHGLLTGLLLGNILGGSGRGGGWGSGGFGGGGGGGFSGGGASGDW